MLHIQTAVVNNPLFLQLQYDTLKFFVEGDYTFTVFNDAKQFPDYSNFGDPSLHRQIRLTCERLNIPCIDIANDHHRYSQCAATRCADAMQAMLAHQRQNPARYLCLDSDMFLIDRMPTATYDGCDAAVVPQVRSNGCRELRYFWNGLYYFDFPRLSNTDRMDWRCNDVEGVWTDVGGGMWSFLESLPTDRVYKIPHLSSCQWSSLPRHLDARWETFLTQDTRNQGANFFSELYDGRFLHYRAGGNWEKRNPQEYVASVGRLQTVVYSICRA